MRPAHRLVLVMAAAAAFFMVPNAHAARHVTAEAIARHAHGDPYQCDVDHNGRWWIRQNACVILVVWRRHPRLRDEALIVAPCESGMLNETGPAMGLFQFIRPTWRWVARELARMYPRSFPAFVRRHGLWAAARHPVWNARGALYLRLSAGRWSGPWYPSRPCHHLR